MELRSPDGTTKCKIELEREDYNELYIMARDIMVFCIKRGCVLFKTDGVLKTIMSNPETPSHELYRRGDGERKDAEEFRRSVDAEAPNLDRLNSVKDAYSYIRGYFWRTYGERIKHPMDARIHGLVFDALEEYRRRLRSFVEALAALEHEQWAHWTRYMLDNATAENIERWRRQIDTPYEALTEKEKESDRVWARKVLDALEVD